MENKSEDFDEIYVTFRISKSLSHLWIKLAELGILAEKSEK